MPRPDKCYICGGIEFWQTANGSWACAKCHPPPVKAPVQSAPAPKQPSPEVLALRDRVRVGNDKLNLAWPRVLAMVGEEGQKGELERWDKAMELLMDLCGELQNRHNYTDCLYLNEDGRKTRKCVDERGFFCMVCPSARKYWMEE